jgi:hypothetical protein
VFAQRLAFWATVTRAPGDFGLGMDNMIVPAMVSYFGECFNLITGWLREQRQIHDRDFVGSGCEWAVWTWHRSWATVTLAPVDNGLGMDNMIVPAIVSFFAECFNCVTGWLR